MKPNVQDSWPARPEHWPEIMTSVEVCQFLRLDGYLNPSSAKRSLRYIRRHQGLPDAGRLGRHVIFLKSTVDRWLESREKSGSKIASDSSLSATDPDARVDDA